MHAHVCSCAYVCVCKYVGIYICAFFCSECCVHFGTSDLGTSTWAGVHVTQVWFYTNVHICEHTRCRLCTYAYMYMCVYACICIWMRMCVYDIAWHVEALLLRFSICAYVSICREIMLFIGKPKGRSRMISNSAYACVCVCVCMYACIGACVYVCTCIYVCLYICMHIHLYTRACGCTYALV